MSQGFQSPHVERLTPKAEYLNIFRKDLFTGRDNTQKTLSYVNEGTAPVLNGHVTKSSYEDASLH